MLRLLKRKAMLNESSTIVAVSTAAGIGGIGVVRLSGTKALEIAQEICDNKIVSRYAGFHSFAYPDNNLIDQGIVIYFPSPNSFTGEDVIEFQAHGSPVVLQQIVNACVETGAVVAEPGEFTKRAYLNNKIDLMQAEAVIDLINASTETAARSAVNSLSGKFSIIINDLLKDLIELRMYVEACLDFPEEEIDFITQGNVAEKINKLHITMQDILKSAQQGKLLRDGLNIVLVGQPNVGKSSLLNQLLGEERAIVTEIAGTTRDSISTHISLHGIPVHIVDTAGLRETDNLVEKMGIEKTWQSLQKAHIALFLVEASNGITEYEKTVLKELSPNTIKIWIFNKIDLLKIAPKVIEEKEGVHVYLSAKTGDGINLLIDQIAGNKSMPLIIDDNQNIFMARDRHLKALSIVQSALTNASINIDAAEIVAEELTQAQHALSTITGEFNPDDLLGKIFSEFCIGK
ncbi:MAG: tRNA uridine-5-carboxymethylaminomethyl(34) synthesis GTPase MnmE [Methylophilaceae bacterium]|nr:tRNA uridine-5-carboxymethylaminomethyl(34) synthesis GTPase MnmE [Methylophilaceae bacterium]